MNKIVLKDNEIEIVEYDGKIDIDYSKEFINKIRIHVIKNAKLQLIYKNECESKYDILFDIDDKNNLKLEEIKNGNKVKILYKYNLGYKSNLNIIKISDILNVNEKNIINLNGSMSKIDCLLKTVSNVCEKYEFVVNHNDKKTFSDIILQGVNLSGNLQFNVTTVIPKGNSGCIANQNNRIINLTENECVIKPNLLIDEYDVVANHSALIGSFKDEELFYMKRLGISEDEATKLLIEGFLKSKLTNKLANNFKKYWR